MIILGLVGMPKSGKGEAVKALVREGWTHISMSGVLKDYMLHDPMFGYSDETQITRNDLFVGTMAYRAKFGPGFLARQCFEAIKKLPAEKQERVTIDGIRHPGEIEEIMKESQTSYFLGIIADPIPKNDADIRFRRLKHDPNQRGEHFEGHRRAEFDKTDKVEWDSPVSEYGSKIGKCLEMVSDMAAVNRGRIMVNGENKKLEILAEEVQEYARSLEGSSGNPERVM